MPAESLALSGLEDLPSPAELAELTSRLGAAEPRELRALWKRAPSPRQIPDLERLLALSRELTVEWGGRAPWERVLLAAGHEGGAEVEAWLDLRAAVEGAVAEWQKSRAILLAHSVVIHANTDPVALRRGLGQVAAHLAKGRAVGALTLLWRRDWKSLLSATRVNGSLPSAAVHVQAIESHLALLESRRQLRERWSARAEPVGLPAFADVSDPPEPVLGRYADHFPELLGWWKARSTSLQELIESTGFDWDAHRERERARIASSTPFELDVHLLGKPLQAAAAARLSVAREVEAEERLGRLARQLEHGPCACPRLHEAVRRRDVAAYRAAYDDLDGERSPR